MQRDVDGMFKAFKGRCFPGFDKENRLNLARSTTPRVGMGAGIAGIWKTVSSNQSPFLPWLLKTMSGM